MTKLPLKEVFNPYTTPAATYVSRPNFEASVDQAFSWPGAELFIYGPSATGKTTLVRKGLEKARIDRYVEIQVPSNPEFSNKTFYKEIAMKLVASSSIEEQKPNAWDMDSVWLKAKIFEYATRWPMPIFVDDARRSHVPVLADLVRMFNQWSQTIKDPRLKLIIVGINIDVKDFLQQRPGEFPRFIAIPLKRFSANELHELIVAGERALRLTFSEDLKDSIVKFSAGLPHVCQHIAYNVCWNADVRETCNQSKSLGYMYFQEAVQRYVEVMMPLFEGHLTLASEFETSRGIPAREVLSTLFDIQEEASDSFGLDPVAVATVVDLMRIMYPNLDVSEVREIVTRLTSPQGGEFLAWSDEQRFTFREPLFRNLYRMYRGGQGPVDQTAIRDFARAIARAMSEAIRPK
jgi:hypothetical protein